MHPIYLLLPGFLILSTQLHAQELTLNEPSETQRAAYQEFFDQRHFGQEPRVLYVGGGVPALSYVPEAGGPKLTTFGFQRSDEGFHADNEYLRIDSFKKAQMAFAKLLHALVDQPKR